MTTEEIIDGLRMTAELFRFDPSTGGDALLNEEDRITVDACEGALKIIESTRWIPCSERMPEDRQRVLVWSHYLGRQFVNSYRIRIWKYMDQTHHQDRQGNYYPNGAWIDEAGYSNDLECVKAWMPLPEEFKEEDDGLPFH